MQKIPTILFASAMAGAIFGTNALAAKGIPASAVQLTKTEIVSAYGGQKVNWRTNTMSGHAVFSKTMVGASRGAWRQGSSSGKFLNQVTFQGNLYCHAAQKQNSKKYFPPICVSVWQDGDTFYEFNDAAGALEAVVTISK